MEAAACRTARHDPRHFSDEQEVLKQRVITMGGVAERHLRLALDGLVGRNQSLLAAVIAGDAEVNDLQVDIDDRCFKLIALQHPVAVDLRSVVSALKINADLARVGDLAVNVAQAAQRYLSFPPVKRLVDIPRMG